MAGEHRHLEHIDARAVRDQRSPVGAVGRGERRDINAEVDRIALIGADEELIAAVINAVAYAGLTRRHEPRYSVGAGEVYQPLLRRLLIAAGDDAEAAARALIYGSEPAFVLFLVDQHVVALAGAQSMT